MLESAEIGHRIGKKVYAREEAQLRETETIERSQLPHRRREYHRRVRGVAHRTVTPKRIAELTVAIQQITDDALTEAVAAADGDGTYDFFRVAYSVPLLVIMNAFFVASLHAQFLSGSDSIAAENSCLTL